MKMPTPSHTLIAPASAPQPATRSTSGVRDNRHAAPVGPPRIADVVLLAGAVRSELAKATKRSRIDLPLDEEHTLLNQWQRQIAQWMTDDAEFRGGTRVIVQHDSPMPTSMLAAAGMMPRFERDPNECRGTGGLLRDLAANYDDDQWLLVATASQVLLEPLHLLVGVLRKIEGDARLLVHQDGTPVGLMLIRCGCLRVLEPIGFIDLKEQGLPRIATTHRVGYALREQPTGLPVRTRADYIRASRWHHLRRAQPAMLLDPFAEDWRCAFRIIEPQAQVHASASLHDAVVLRGARVERGATIVRSIVCPGAVVTRGQVVIDQLVEPR